MANPHQLLAPMRQSRRCHLLTLFICLICLNLTKAQEAQNNQFAQTRAENVQYHTEDRMSMTDRQRVTERTEMVEFYKSDTSDLKHQFAFEVTNDFEEFHFHLPTDHVVFFLTHIYVLKNNAYIQIPNIEVEPALHLVVYQNNHRIIAQKSFYFQNVIKINGKAGSTYMMRFFSPTPKLLVISHNNFIQISAFEGKVKNTQMQQNSLRIASIDNKLNEIFKNLRFTYRMELEQRKIFTNNTSSYVEFEYLQMLLVVLVCLLQIKVVGKLFKTQSIV